MSSVRNKVVWLTGASSGIGEALAYELAKGGARLILSARRVEELERVKGNCASPHVHLLPMDVVQTDKAGDMVAEALQVFGQVDILICNAGVSQRSFAMDTNLSVDRMLMDVNYFGPVSLTKAMLPHFIQRGTGHFVIVTSVTGVFGTPYRSGYAAAKHALHGFFDSFRAELWKTFGDHIAVTLIGPGFIHTNMTIRALTGDGSLYGKMDESTYNGKSPQWCAQRMVRAIVRRKEEVFIGGIETWGVPFKRLFPGLFSRFIRSAKVR